MSRRSNIVVTAIIENSKNSWAWNRIRRISYGARPYEKHAIVIPTYWSNQWVFFDLKRFVRSQF